MDNENTALAVIDSQPQDISQAWTQDDLRALQETVAKGCNPSQFKVFVAACKRLQLDPFARQITPIVMGGGMTPQVTIDGFRLIAERTRKYRGRVGPYWCGPDGEWKDAWLADTAPVACKVGVRREGFAEIVWGTARTKAYAKGGLWVTMPDVMIAKVAESIALRVAFPNELSGVYTREEMQQALREEDDANYVEAVPAQPQHQQQQQQAAAARPAAATNPLFERWQALQALQSNEPAMRTAKRYNGRWLQMFNHGAPFSDEERATFTAWLEREEERHGCTTVTEEEAEAATGAEPIPFDLRDKSLPITDLGA